MDSIVRAERRRQDRRDPGGTRVKVASSDTAGAVGVDPSENQMIKFATSSYSFHRFGRGPEGHARPSFQSMIETCARLGFDGIELLGVHFESTEREQLAALRQHAFRHGI